jgi:hypothetical protein
MGPAGRGRARREIHIGRPAIGPAPSRCDARFAFLSIKCVRPAGRRLARNPAGGARRRLSSARLARPRLEPIGAHWRRQRRGAVPPIGPAGRAQSGGRAWAAADGPRGSPTSRRRGRRGRRLRRVRKGMRRGELRFSHANLASRHHRRRLSWLAGRRETPHESQMGGRAAALRLSTIRSGRRLRAACAHPPASSVSECHWCCCCLEARAVCAGRSAADRPL